MEDWKQQGANHDQGNNHNNVLDYENVYGSFNFNGGDYIKQLYCKRSNYAAAPMEFISNGTECLNNRQDSSDAKDSTISAINFTYSNCDSDLSELSGSISHLPNKGLQSSKGQDKPKPNENMPVKFNEDGQAVSKDCIFEQNQGIISHVHNLRKSTRKRACCSEIVSMENVANSNKKKKNECEKHQEKRKPKRQGNTEKIRMKQEVKTLQRQVSALQNEIACLKQKLSQASPSRDFILTPGHRKAFSGDVEKAPLTPQSDGSAMTVARASVPFGRKCVTSRKYFCPKCTRSFTNYNRLCRHVGIHSGKKPYSCKVCSKTFNLANLLSLHMIKHSYGHTQQHEVVSKGFTNSDLKDSLQIHGDFRALQKECKVCGKRFSRACHLLRHSLIHTGHRPFSCNVCDKRFYKSDHLSRHMVVHTGRKPYQCDQCHKSYVTNSELNMHKTTHSGERLHMCDVCGLRFTRHAHMVRHSKVHTGEKPFYCDTCGRSFSRLNHLQRHQKLHQNDPTFRCYFCSSEFGNKESLKGHILSHDIKKAPPCPWCGIEFRSKSKLLKHAEVYHQKSASAIGGGDVSLNGGISNSLKKLKEHVCDQCNKSYKTSGALVVHKRSHSGERPYVCDTCAVSFSRSSSLIRHKRSHTGEKPHVCPICEKAYARRHQLKKHENTTHGSKGPNTDDATTQFSVVVDGIDDIKDCLRRDVPYFSSIPLIADNPTTFDSSDHVNSNVIKENIILDL